MYRFKPQYMHTAVGKRLAACTGASAATPAAIDI